MSETESRTAPVVTDQASSPTARPSFRQSWVGRLVLHVAHSPTGSYQAGFIGIMLLALLLRLWELGGRTMHYDEAIHVVYAWRLSNFEEYIHSPWMHGPFQIELVAFLLWVLGDSAFSARLAYVLFGTALVGLPYLLRNQLGRAGALATAAMLALSPALLYFSRFGRNDIIMAVLSLGLFISLWRYCETARNRYLYIAAALLALLFSSKETAYFYVLVFGGLAFVMALPWQSLPRLLPFRRRPPETDDQAAGADAAAPTDSREPSGAGQPEGRAAAKPAAGWGGASGLLPRLAWLLQRADWRDVSGPIGFLILLITITLPQWSAGVEVARRFSLTILEGLPGGMGAPLASLLNLDIVNPENSGNGIVGGPAWAGPELAFPLFNLPAWLQLGGAALLIGGYTLAVWKVSQSQRQGIIGRLIPVAAAVAGIVALQRPTDTVLDTLVVGAALAGLLVSIPLLRFTWRQSLLLLFLPFLAGAGYALLLTPALHVNDLLNAILPAGVGVTSEANAVPVNVLAPLGVVGLAVLVSLVVGLRWKGGAWLGCALIFYSIWTVLYTTLFTNWAGIFTGVWQGLGYWIAQQEVARGNQPWYYYFVGMSVYEFLPLIFGLIGAVVFARRRDRVGIALAFWAVVSLLAYTTASEKMPWLLVNITLPFILLAGKLAGELIERVPWRQLPARGRVWLLLAPPMALVYLVGGIFLYTGSEKLLPLLPLMVMAGAAGLAVLSVWLARRAGWTTGLALTGVGVAGLLLLLTGWVAFRAAYTYDDSHKEILVYAQGSADLQKTYAELEEQLLTQPEEPGSPVVADYELWYPLQWYVRDMERDGQIRFTCFKGQDSNSGCGTPSPDEGASVILVVEQHQPEEPESMTGYQQNGPYRNLLWFPESYRRPGENRIEEPFLEQFWQDWAFFLSIAVQRDYWNAALDYLLFRQLDSDWFDSRYYTYQAIPPDLADGGG